MPDECRPSLLLLYWGRRGGGARMTFEWARALGRRPDVLTRLSISSHCELRGDLVALGLPTDLATLPRSPRRFVSGLPGLVAGWSRLFRTVRRHAPCTVVVVMGSPWSDVVGRPLGWLVRRGGARLVRVVHDAAPHPGDRNRSPAWIERQAMRGADTYVVLSEHVEQQLVDAGVDADAIWRSEHGPFTLGEVRAQIGEPHDPFRLLFFGRLAAYKGLDLLVEAARLVEQRGVAVEIRIVGDGELDLGDPPANVAVDRRWVPEEELRETLVWSDALVLPYVEASQSGVAPMATSLGIPSIVTPVGGLVEQVDSGVTAIVAERVDAPALADAIVLLATDGDRYRTMAVGCRDVSAADAAWDEIVAGLVDRLRDVR